MKKLTLLLLLILPICAFAQYAQTVKGFMVDGKFELENVPAGLIDYPL